MRNYLDFNVARFLIRGVFLCVICFTGILTAQSLDSLKAVLRRSNPELRALGLEYRSALLVGAQESQLPAIEIDGGVFVLPVETRTGPQQFRLGVTQLLPWPGKLAAMSELADARAKPLLASIAARQLDLIYELEVAYFQLAGLDARRKVREKSLDFNLDLEQVALNQVENGPGNSIDAYRLQLRDQTINRELEDLRFAARRAMVTINQLLNREVDTEVNVELETDEIVAMILGNAPDLANDDPDLSAHPSLVAIALRQEISRQVQRVNNLDARPDFGIGVDYISTGRLTDVGLPNNGRDAIIPRAMIRIPLSKGKFRARHQEEDLRMLALDARRESLELDFRATIKNALLIMENAANQLYFLKEQLQTLENTLQAARKEYQKSTGRIDDLLEFEQLRVTLNTEAITAQINILQQQAVIDRYLVIQQR